MNLTRAEKVRLGIFVGTASAVLLGTVIVLAGLKAFESRDEYRVRFSDNVGGLEVSAQVKYQGLRVGRVDAMHIAADEPSKIEVVLSVETGTVLYTGTTASMESSGLTGLKNINLSPGDPRQAVLPPGSMLPTEKSFFDKLTGQAEAITLKVETIANQLATWTSEENRIRIETILDNMSNLTASTNRLVTDVREPLTAALTEVAKSGNSVRATADATTKTLNEVRDELRLTLEAARGTLVETRRIMTAIDNKQLSETVSAAASSMRSLDKRLSSAELGITIDRIGRAMAKLANLMDDLELTVRAGREDVIMSLKHVRQATEDLREFSRIIAQDPSVLVRGSEAKE